MVEQSEQESNDLESSTDVKEPSTEFIQKPISNLFNWQVILMLVIIVLAWATPNVIGRYLSIKSSLTPLQIAVLRYFPAAVTLILFSLITKKGKLLLKILQEKWVHLLIASIILSSFVILQMFSVTQTSASASSFLLNVNPIITFVLSIIILKERHRWWGGLGVIIAVAGIFFVAVPIDEISTLFSSGVLVGNILAFGSGVMWAVYSIYLKKFLKDEDPIITTTWNLSFSSIILLISMFSVDGWFSPAPAYYHILLTIFMGLVPTAIAFTLWFETIKRITVQKASAFQFLIPVISTLFALALGETIDFYFGLGGALILIGLVITQLS